MQKSLQFELWTECNSFCKYCYLGEKKKFTSDELKIQACKDALDKIKDLKTFEEEGYNVLAYIGGEFFQGQLNSNEVKTSFFDLIDYSSKLLDKKIIEAVWHSATLTIGDQKDLYDMLSRYNTWYEDDFIIGKGVWLITSYDTIGRFHNEKMHENWKYHMKKIKELYPFVKLNTCMILTQDLMQKYIDGVFSFQEFRKEFNTNFFFKHPSSGFFSDTNNTLENRKEFEKLIGLSNFFPKRETALKFLKKLYLEDYLLFDKLFNIKYRADKLYRSCETRMQESERRKGHKNESDDSILNEKCGHLVSYMAYIDSDACLMCDKFALTL